MWRGTSLNLGAIYLANACEFLQTIKHKSIIIHYLYHNLLSFSSSSHCRRKVGPSMSRFCLARHERNAPFILFCRSTHWALLFISQFSHDSTFVRSFIVSQQKLTNWICQCASLKNYAENFNFFVKSMLLTTTTQCITRKSSHIFCRLIKHLYLPNQQPKKKLFPINSSLFRSLAHVQNEFAVPREQHISTTIE